MLFGIQASQDTLLSEIGRSLQEDIRLKTTEEPFMGFYEWWKLERQHLCWRGLLIAVIPEALFFWGGGAREEAVDGCSWAA